MRISDWSSDVCSSDLPERSQYVIAFELDQVAEQRRRERNDFETRAHQRAPIVEAQALHGTRRAKRIRIAARLGVGDRLAHLARSEEHTSELQSLLRIPYAVFYLKQKPSFYATYHKALPP